MVAAFAHHQSSYQTFEYTLRTSLLGLKSTQAKLVCQDIVCCTLLKEVGLGADSHFGSTLVHMSTGLVDCLTSHA